MILNCFSVVTFHQSIGIKLLEEDIKEMIWEMDIDGSDDINYRYKPLA